jgi:predicted DNA-binding transcriptional regulator YafY
MSQRQQLERIFYIDASIRAGRYPNANQLAEELDVSKRVIFNDREFMINRLGAPIEFDWDRGGWWYTDTTWVLPNMMITEGELLAFFLSVDVARRFLGTGLEAALISAVDKISKGVKGPVSVDLETLRQHYTFAGPALISMNEAVLLDLHRAIRERRRLWMRYYTASRGESRGRTVSPYHLYNFQGEWFLVAFDDYRHDFRSFLVGRIEDWRVLEAVFKPDPGFSIDKYMGNAFRTERGGESYQVVVRFDEGQARYIRERTWHKGQTIEELSEGGLILRFSTSGLGDVRRWVLQYGGQAEVLEPDVLREAMRREVVRMAERYGGKNPTTRPGVDS